MIHYMRGDASRPRLQDGSKHVLIAHVCNNIGVWGGGFTASLDANVPEAGAEYRGHLTYMLGDVLLAKGKDAHVANMIAQSGVGRKNGPPIRYEALFDAMKKVRDMPIFSGCEMHAPRFGSGLAGGRWDIVECFINCLWKDVDVYIWDPIGA